MGVDPDRSAVVLELERRLAGLAFQARTGIDPAVEAELAEVEEEIAAHERAERLAALARREEKRREAEQAERDRQAERERDKRVAERALQRRAEAMKALQAELSRLGETTRALVEADADAGTACRRAGMGTPRCVSRLQSFSS